MSEAQDLRPPLWLNLPERGSRVEVGLTKPHFEHALSFIQRYSPPEHITSSTITASRSGASEHVRVTTGHHQCRGRERYVPRPPSPPVDSSVSLISRDTLLSPRQENIRQGRWP